MNYSKIYNDLIHSAKFYPKIDPYKESHHIIPVCMGGSDDSENKILLTARQHYLAHWLLYKIHGTSKLVHAWHNMARIGNGQEDRRQNSHLFEIAKKHRSTVLSLEMTGSGNHFYGRKHTQESKDKSLKTRAETYENDPELRAKTLANYAAGVSKKWKGVPKTPESNLKRARPNLIMLRSWIEPDKIVRVDRNKRDEYPSDIWVNPWKVTCKMKKMEYCGFWNIDINSRESYFSEAVANQSQNVELIDIAIEIYLKKVKNEN